MKFKRLFVPALFATSLTGMLFPILGTAAVTQDELFGVIDLSWDPPVGSTLEIGGYKIYAGKGSGEANYGSPIDVGNQTAYHFQGLEPGITYYFAAKSYDTSETVESGFSNEVPSVPKILMQYSAPNAVIAGSIFSVKDTTSTAAIPSSIPFTLNFGSLNTTLPRGGQAAISTAASDAGTTKQLSVCLKVSSGYQYCKPQNISIVAPGTSITQPPIAAIKSSINKLGVSFIGENSGGTATQWDWNFGDSQTQTTATNSVTHTYSHAGTYNVTLTEIGPGGNSTTTAYVTVSATPSGGSSSNIPGLVAAYSFDESVGSTAFDSSQNGNNGTLSKFVRRSAKAVFGKSVQFRSRASKITIKNSPSLQLGEGMTLEAWIQPTELANKAGLRNLIYKYNSEQKSFDYSLSLNGAQNFPESSLNVGAGTLTTAAEKTSATLKQWMHLAATYDAKTGTQTLYVDGNPVSMSQTSPNQSILSSSTETGSDLQIGGMLSKAMAKAGQKNFIGLLDEVRIYNRALTAEEIKKDMVTAVSHNLGYKNIEASVATNESGTAEAFPTTAKMNGKVSYLHAYIDPASTAQKILVGIYSDNNGNPDQLLASGKLTKAAIKLGAWNRFAMPLNKLKVSGGTKYWLAIMGINGSLSFRVNNAGTALDENNAAVDATTKISASNLEALPKVWTTANQTNRGPISFFGSGDN